MYSKQRMKDLYVLGKRANDTYCVKGEISGRFKKSNCELIDEQLYELKKEEAIQKIGEEEEKQELSRSEIISQQANQRNLLLFYLWKKTKPKDKKYFYTWLNQYVSGKWSYKAWDYAQMGKDSFMNGGKLDKELYNKKAEKIYDAEKNNEEGY